MADTPDQVFVFGNFTPGSGHQLYRHDRIRTARVHQILPGGGDITTNSYAGEDEIEGMEIPRHRLVPSVLQWLAEHDWSVTTWWDRQALGDSRRGSYVAIYAQGRWTRSQLIDATRALAPWAIRVPVQ